MLRADFRKKLKNEKKNKIKIIITLISMIKTKIIITLIIIII